MGLLLKKSVNFSCLFKLHRLKGPYSGAALEAVSTMAEEGQDLPSHMLVWPGPTSWGKGGLGDAAGVLHLLCRPGGECWKVQLPEESLDGA